MQSCRRWLLSVWLSVGFQIRLVFVEESVCCFRTTKFPMIAYSKCWQLHGQEDYYDTAGDFWDVEGLEDDLRLAQVPGRHATSS